jgi:hypothetical protein
MQSWRQPLGAAMTHFLHQHLYMSLFAAFAAGVFYSAYMVAKDEARRKGEPFKLLRWPTWNEMIGWTGILGFLATPYFVQYIAYPIYCANRACPTDWTMWVQIFIGCVPVWAIGLKVLSSIDSWHDKLVGKPA